MYESGSAARLELILFSFLSILTIDLAIDEVHLIENRINSAEQLKSIINR